MLYTDKDIAWYALHVRPRFEKVVSRNLKAKGYEEYLPIYRRVSRWSDRSKEIELPLFPGYVFCRFNVHDRLPVLLIPGVSSVVGIGKSAMPIDPSELDGVRSMLQSGASCEPWPFLQLGQVVRVSRGPLAGTEGIVVRTKDDYRLVISVSLLQRSVAVEIDRECLEVIPSPKSPRLPQRMPDSTSILAG